MRDIDQVTLLAGQTIALGGAPNTFGANFPMGRGWYKTRLRFKLVVTANTATGPITNGGLFFIKNIFMKTDANEILCNMSGKALHEMLKAEYGVAPYGDVLVVEDGGTFYIYLDIPHILPEGFKRRNDTILDTGRYKSVQLRVTLGSVADFFTIVGDAAVTVTLDAEAITTAGIIPGKAQPILYRSMYEMAPVIPSVQTFLDLDRARDLAINKVMFASTALATAGVAFTGAGDDTVVSDFDIKDQDKFYVQSRLWGFNQSEDKQFYGLEYPITGFNFFEFAKDDSIYSSLYTGNKTQLRLTWRNNSAEATDQISAAYDAVRQLVK